MNGCSYRADTMLALQGDDFKTVTRRD